jgi:hypothetical protein
MTVVELKPTTIAKLELGPNDIVVVRSSENISADRADQIGKTVKEAVGDHRVLVLAPNLRIEVLAQR